MKGSCWDSPIPPSGDSVKTIPSWGKSAREGLKWKWFRRSLGFRWSSGKSWSPSARWSTSSRVHPTTPPCFTQGYGLTFGLNERKAMVMALVDRALRCTELGEKVEAPAQNEEFVLYHSDSVEASGFVQHLKLPHYVDFQSELTLVRNLRAPVENKRRRRYGWKRTRLARNLKVQPSRCGP